MFTGLVQAVGTVRSLQNLVLTVDAPTSAWANDPWQLGESVAVQGCCLTVVDSSDGLRFDLSEETLARTSLGQLAAGSKVNLERAMRPMDRLGGHIVQGHVDGLAHVVSVKELQGSWEFVFEVPQGGEKYLIDKGSVCLDGVSLTVVAPEGSRFTVAVIPHTYEVTSLSDRAAGDRVNLEYDVLAKHVEKLLQSRI